MLLFVLDKVYEFPSKRELDSWLERFRQFSDQAYRILEKSETPKLPSYDDPNSTWEQADHSRLVARILNSEFSGKNHEMTWHFAHPYVAVIHESGKGYYLNRAYHLIGSVNNIIVPGSNNFPLTHCVEIAFKHQPASLMVPEWTLNLSTSTFTTYWMY
jgi:hypothetical protein